jgi:hypothetical protein
MTLCAPNNWALSQMEVRNLNKEELQKLRSERFDLSSKLWEPKEKELSVLAKVLWGVWIGGAATAAWFGGERAAAQSGVVLAIICWLIYFLLNRSMKKDIEAQVEARYPRRDLWPESDT